MPSFFHFWVDWNVLFSLDCCIGLEHGSDWSDSLGSTDPRVLCCQATPSCWICQEWVEQCWCLVLIAILQAQPAVSMESCKGGWGTPKGDVAQRTGMTHFLQQCKFQCIYSSAATWTVSFRHWSQFPEQLNLFHLSCFVVFLFYSFFITKKTWQLIPVSLWKMDIWRIAEEWETISIGVESKILLNLSLKRSIVGM